MAHPTRIVFLCTGNAARSVMAATMFADRTNGFDIVSAGTHVIEGLPMSTRTRNALRALGHQNPAHLSHQLTFADLEHAALVVAMEPGHLRYIEREFPMLRGRAGLFGKLVELLAGASMTGPLFERVDRLNLAEVQGSVDDEVIDPAGGEQPDFDLAARALDSLVNQLIESVGDDGCAV